MWSFASVPDNSMDPPSPPRKADDSVEIEFPSFVPGNIPEFEDEVVQSPPQAGNGDSATSSSSKSEKPPTITKDKDYFMEGGFIVFQVERCLFRVPSYLFSKESSVFDGKFCFPQTSTDPHDPSRPQYRDTKGSSEANPIILPDEFTKNDFRCLLKALYPLSFTLHLSLTKEEWLTVLQLSTKWHFLNMRKTAISELELDASPQVFGSQSFSLTSLEYITYGRKYHIYSWLLTGLVDLVMRHENSITDEEALSIDQEHPTTAYRLFRTREKRIQGCFGQDKHNDRSVKFNVRKEVVTLFNDELEQLRVDGWVYMVLPEKKETKPEFRFIDPLSRPSSPSPPSPQTPLFSNAKTSNLLEWEWGGI